MSKLKEKARWLIVLVKSGEEPGDYIPVAELTEAQAKDALCDEIELTEKVADLAARLSALLSAGGYAIN